LKPETRNWINTLIGLVALIAAGLFLYRRFRNIDLAEITAYLHSLERMRLTVVFFWMIISYLVLTGYDWLSLRFLEKKIPYPGVALASFVGYSISKNLGISWLTGGSMRYRFYSRWGMNLKDVSKLVLFNTSTFLLGFFFWGGFSFLFYPLEEEIVPFLPRSLFPIVGLLLWLIPVVYLAVCRRSKREIHWRGRRGSLPPFWIALSQSVLGAIDVLVTLWVLYLILPPGTVSIGAFVAAYFMAEVVAILTHAPGGIGVFESSMLMLLEGRLSEAILLSSFLLYRVIYFLIPLVVGIALLAYDEIRYRPGRSLDAILHQKSGNR
jgi:phosphatidylglycerol lysyltransferase